MSREQIKSKRKKEKKLGDKRSKKVKKSDRLLYRFYSSPVLPLIIITFVIYLNVLWNGFTYDDKFIFKNELIRDFRNAKAFFTEDYFKMSEEQSYRPIVTLSYMLEYPLWKLNPTGYHFTNLILHILVALTLYKILTLFIDKWAGFLGVLIYSLHPLTSEVVNSIGFREDSLCALFLLLTILFYKLFSSRNKYFYIVLSIFSYCLSLLSKEMAITLPILLILLDYVFEGSGVIKKRVVIYIFFISLSIFYLFLQFKIMYVEPGEKVGYYGGSLLTAIMSIPKLLITYAQLIVFPHPLSVDRYINPVKSLLDIYFWIGIIFISVLIVGIVKLKSGYRYGILWFLVTLMPVLNLVPIYNPFAERYMYIPLIGIAIVVAFLLDRYRYNKIIWAIFVYALIGFSLRTHYRNYVWKNDITLFSNAVKYSCRPRAFYNLGIAYYESKEYEKAIETYKKAIVLKPDYYQAYNNIGIAYNSLKKVDDALESIKMSLTINPKNENAYNNLSVSLRLKGDMTGSIEAGKKAIEINPEYAEGYINLGTTYMNIRNFDEAISAFKKAIEINNNSFEAYASLGNLYFTQVNYDKAIENYQMAIKIKPDSALIHNNLGIAYDKLGKYDEAIGHYEKAILLDPGYTNAYNNLALLYTMREYKQYFIPHKAINLAKKACELTNYKDSETLDTLAEAYAASGDYDKAIEYELEARAFSPADKKNRFEERLEMFRKKKEETK